MKILITGSDGFIGRHTAHVLKGHDLTLWGRDRDLRQPWDSIGQFDVVIHLAARVGVKYFTHDYNAYQNNYEIDRQFIDALKACPQQPKVIYASTSEVIGSNMDASEDAKFSIFPQLRGSYALEKAHTEMQLRAFARNFTIVRFFNVTGSDHTDEHGHVVPVFVKRALQGLPLQLHNGGNDLRTFCAVDDVANALKFIAERRGHKEHGGYKMPEVLNVGSHLAENTVSIRKLAELVAEYVHGVQFVNAAEDQHIAARSPDVSRLLALGVSCPTTLRQIVESSVAYWRSKI